MCMCVCPPLVSVFYTCVHGDEGGGKRTWELGAKVVSTMRSTFLPVDCPYLRSDVAILTRSGTCHGNYYWLQLDGGPWIIVL